MRILLDENTPRGVRRILTGHDVRTAPEMGWAAYSNGQLLDEAEKAGFDALVTCDQNLVFQQNLTDRNIAVVILSTNIWPIIRAQPHRVQRAVGSASLNRPLRPLAQIPASSRLKHERSKLCKKEGQKTKRCFVLQGADRLPQRLQPTLWSVARIGPGRHRSLYLDL